MLELDPTHMLGIVTVTYHPNIGILREQLASLPDNACKVIVDNGSPQSILQSLRNMAVNRKDVFVLSNMKNMGLAAAVNRGVQALCERAPGVNFVLLLDQDSEPQPGSVQILMEAHQSLVRRGRRVGAVGPQLKDAETGLVHGFHQMTSWRWRRTFPSTGKKDPLEIANINGSGTLMSVSVFKELGGLDEAFFIDHVDTEWAFRLLSADYSLWGVPQAVFVHRMGRRSVRFWLFGWRLWPVRPPERHRYLFRNTLWLMKRPYAPRVWKIWAGLKLFLTIMVYGIFDVDRRAQLRAMAQGVMQGMKTHGGRK